MWKRELIKNKIISLVIILLGVVPILVDGDGTFFVLTLMFGIPLFFSKENWIMGGDSAILLKRQKRRYI